MINFQMIFMGASTGAYQIEGAWDTDGKGPFCPRCQKIPAGTTDFKVASDHYHRYEEKMSNCSKELGMKAYRFLSISSRSCHAKWRR